MPKSDTTVPKDAKEKFVRALLQKDPNTQFKHILKALSAEFGSALSMVEISQIRRNMGIASKRPSQARKKASKKKLADPDQSPSPRPRRAKPSSDQQPRVRRPRRRARTAANGSRTFVRPTRRTQRGRVAERLALIKAGELVFEGTRKQVEAELRLVPYEELDNVSVFRRVPFQATVTVTLK